MAVSYPENFGTSETAKFYCLARLEIVVRRFSYFIARSYLLILVFHLLFCKNVISSSISHLQSAFTRQDGISVYEPAKALSDN